MDGITILIMNTAEQRKKWYAKHKQEQLQRTRAWYQKNRKKMSENGKVYAMENKVQIKERKHKYHQRYYQERKSIYKDRKLKYKYGISLKEFEYLLIKQDNKCAICKNSLSDQTTVIDHEHSSNKIRGILCRSCNTGLGFFGDDPEILNQAVAYLMEFHRLTNL
jgi:hypothetical protein